jgi:type I restriction enzyme S subunit
MSSWPFSKLCDVASVSAGSSAPQGDHYFEAGEFNFVRVQDVGRYGFTTSLVETKDKVNQRAISEKRLKLARKGASIFPKSGASILTNSRAVLGVDSYVVSHLAIVEAKQEILDDYYLHYFLRTIDFGEITQSEEGYPSLRLSEISNIVIPVPPLDEQRRIVARIEEMTCRAEDAIKLQNESSSICNHIKASYIRRVAELCNKIGWKKLHLGDKKIAKLIMGQSPSGDTYNRNRKGLPLLNGPREFGKLHPDPIQWTTDSKRQCKKGDILFCVRGSTTGRMNWADQTYSIGRGVAAIRANNQNVLPEFLYSMVEVQVSEILHNAEGGVFPNFNKDQLSELIVPLPPMVQQQKIVEEMVSLKKMIAKLRIIQQEIYQEMKAFHSALIAKAFRGKL